MKKKVFPVLLLICLLFVAESISMPGKQTSMYGCQVKFSIKNAGIEVSGSMKGVITEIKFNPEDLSQSCILATADPSTINTGIKIRDTHLKRSDYFDIVNYPEIHFRSKAFHKTGKNNFIGLFDLTIKGITKEITIPFTRTYRNSTVYNGSFEINRLDFNLGEKSIILDEKVKIFISAGIQ